MYYTAHAESSETISYVLGGKVDREACKINLLQV